MKILFLNPPFGHKRPEGLDAPMGIMYLGAVLKQYGHTCTLVDNVWAGQNDWTKWNYALSERPDIVFINTHIRYSDDTHNAMKLLRTGNPLLTAVAFGPQASTEPLRLLSEMGFNICIKGEPEEVVPGMLEEIKKQSAVSLKLKPGPGIATLDFSDPDPAPRVDVERLPFPDWDLADYGRYIETTNNAVVMASRGQSNTDAFNQPPLIYAGSPERRCTAERVIAELAALRNKYHGHYMILFHDEIFTEDRQWTIDLCARLRELRLGLPFWCFTRPEFVDEALCIVMRKAGFAGISMGMESASDRVLKMLGRDITSGHIRAGFKAAHGAGLLTVGSVMIGTPGCGVDAQDETVEEIKATADMAAKLHPDVLTVTLTTPLPGTLLYENCKDRIAAKSQEDFNIYHVWEGKYPVHLNRLRPEDLAVWVGVIRSAWKIKIWKTALRTGAAGLYNSAFRNTLWAQVSKVIRRKIVCLK